MPERVLETECVIPRPVEEVFPFFSDARNLEAITPPDLRLRVTTGEPIEMKAGALIDYTLRVRGLPMRWRTRITAWEPGRRFVDEQIKGPYRQWIHEHTFFAEGGSTRMRDVVRYRVPMDFLVHNWLVRPDIERIFAFRSKVIRERFGAMGS
jgi:ligand-binding SRPBCC domain-containing protein